MEEVNNKKQRNMFMIGLVSLLLVVLGATYAYFAVNTITNFNTSTINATASGVGTVALNGDDVSLSMSITALDMVQGNSNVTYYASSSGKTTTETEEVIGVASVIPTTDTNYYHCEYTLNISHTGTNDMYNLFNHQTNNTYDYTNRGTGQVILLINGEEYDWASTNGMPSTIDGEFYIKGAETVNLTAGLKFVNISNVDQTYLAGADIAITITLADNSFTCTAEEEPPVASEALIALQPTNTTKISRYTGPVTDSCGTTTCTTINSAQNVYVFTSNDINNAIFENFCWKIIRTTETGGVKLLYNGLPSNGECTATGNDTMLTAAQMNTASNTITYSQGGAYDKPAYVGYMYNPNTLSGTYKQQLRGDATYDLNTTDSLFKEKIEYWFSNSNIDESKLEDAVFCNDRSLASDSPVTEAQLESATSGNLSFKNYYIVSTLECTNITDSFNTANTKAQTNYKVGFMTEPERYLVTANNTNFDVLAIGNFAQFMTGTPYNTLDNDAFIRTPGGDGGPGVADVAYQFGVRPVVSASSSVRINDGTGSTTDPFIFE